jgi:hypothetical protein
MFACFVSCGFKESAVVVDQRLRDLDSHSIFSSVRDALCIIIYIP